jgi:hypothetical protein
LRATRPDHVAIDVLTRVDRGEHKSVHLEWKVERKTRDSTRSSKTSGRSTQK